ncbi:hypothetical protein JRI60_08895 [Archangium violaceum]|uniref:hypothetical protein n=1 Tax=Archangium violaceum TaxID=83451 RepID=UPI00194F037D|nr:hypothetical protein [Archangium violaceum]QRN99117.1 hypothetical protein JRI60_08895 [Archangium violaceum]
MSQVVSLKLYNQSNDKNNSQIVIFQKNVATDFDELSIAWRVIQNLGRGNYHPFTYSLALDVSANDSWNNFTPTFDASPGELWDMSLTSSGNELQLSTSPATSPEEVQVRNALPQGAIDANVFRDNLLLATKTSIAPGQKAVFKFKPTIFIGVASQIQQGKVMDSAIISDINTEISLLGIKSADIVMSGGGPGTSSTPFHFTLQNVTRL